KSGEIVLERRGNTGGITCRGARGTECLAAAKLNTSAGVVKVEIDMDVRELASELEGMLAMQVGDVVLKVGSRVLEVYGTATPAAQRGKSAADFDIRKSTSNRISGVE